MNFKEAYSKCLPNQYILEEGDSLEDGVYWFKDNEGRLHRVVRGKDSDIVSDTSLQRLFECSKEYKIVNLGRGLNIPIYLIDELGYVLKSL